MKTLNGSQFADLCKSNIAHLKTLDELQEKYSKVPRSLLEDARRTMQVLPEIKTSTAQDMIYLLVSLAYSTGRYDVAYEDLCMISRTLKPPTISEKEVKQ